MSIQFQEELAKVIKAQAKRLGKPSTTPAALVNYNASTSQAMKQLVEDEDIAYNNEDIDAGDADDDADDYTGDDEDDEDDEDDDEDDDDNVDDEEVVSGCPDYCRCVGQYAAVTTAR